MRTGSRRLSSNTSSTASDTTIFMGRTSAAVSTESLLADKNDRQLAASVPQTGKVVVYKAEDTLVSNIRPYFKKMCSWASPRPVPSTATPSSLTRSSAARRWPRPSRAGAAEGGLPAVAAPDSVHKDEPDPESARSGGLSRQNVR